MASDLQTTEERLLWLFERKAKTDVNIWEDLSLYADSWIILDYFNSFVCINRQFVW